MGSDSKLHAVLEDAEKLLLQGDYFSAEKYSRKALSSAARLTDPAEKNNFGDRAAAVLLQALFETNRFSNARPSLITAFGSMEKSPPTTLLLWLSLALDTDEKSKAQSLMLSLLQAGPCRGAPVCRWNHRQYLALIHLYAIEVLLPALRDPSEVRLWLQRQPFLPLDPREKQFLEDEVEAAAAAATLQAENGGSGSSNGSITGTVGGAGTGQGMEPTGSTDLDHIIGGGGRTGGGGANSKSGLPLIHSGAASSGGGGAIDSGRRRVTDYSSMPLPTDQISPMKNPNNKISGGSGSGGGGDNGRPSSAVGMTMSQNSDQQTNPPYLMSFSPVPSDLPFGSLAEYDNEQQQQGHNHNHHNHHHHNEAYEQQSGSRPLSPLPSIDLDGISTSKNNSTTTIQQQQSQGDVNACIELDWLGKLHQAAFDAAGSVYSTINDFIVPNTRDSSTQSTSASTSRKNLPVHNSNEMNSIASTATLATVAGVSIFAYALYTERVFIKNSARKAWKGVEDLVKIAFLFTPNPLTPVTTSYAS